MRTDAKKEKTDEYHHDLSVTHDSCQRKKQRKTELTGYTQVPAQVTTRYNKRLSLADRGFYVLILQLSGKNKYCYATNEQLADYANISEATAKRHIKKLSNEQWVKITGKNTPSRRIYPKITKK